MPTSNRPSKTQRGYMHGVLVLAIAVHLEWSVDDTYQYLKERYSKPRILINKHTGEVCSISGGTKKYTKRDYAMFINKIRIEYLSEIRLEVPNSEEVTDEYIQHIRTLYDNQNQNR